MKIVAHASKLYVFGICLFFCILATGIVLIANGEKRWLSAPFFGIAILTILVSLVGLLRGKPIFSADETGFNDSRLGIGVIQWSDILAFRHAPRVEKALNGKMDFSPFDAWRPIQLWVNPPKASLLAKFQALSAQRVHPDFPFAFYMQIEFAGLDVSSARFAEIIRQKSPKAKEMLENQTVHTHDPQRGYSSGSQI